MFLPHLKNVVEDWICLKKILKCQNYNFKLLEKIMKKIPLELEILHTDVYWSTYYLSQYKTLFEFNESRLELMKETALNFFSTVQYLLWNEFIIGIGRFTDPENTINHDNLSLNMIPALAQRENWVFTPEMENLLTNANKRSKPIKEWRNKRVAHRDFGTATINHSPLSKITLEMVESVYQPITDLLSKIYLEVYGKKLYWETITSHDASSLINYLKYSVIYLDEIKNNNLREKLDFDKENARYRDA
jgi:hypothetical protein